MKIIGNFAKFLNRFGILLLFICSVLYFVADLVILTLFLVIIGIVLLEGMKLWLWLKNSERIPPDSYVHEPKISVHLAICNEPPEMVIRTIQGVLEQRYGNFELIVVDNNTVDRKLWSPVAEFCNNLEKVRFFHLERWPFYKSGALNFARKVTDVRAEFIFVLDADYILTIDALHLAASNIVTDQIALVQFPQAYRCESPRHIPILGEFDYFFDFFCSKANSCYGALATGTLSLIRIEALDNVGGWPVNSITEDAELGARLQGEGYDIKYVDRVIGKGIAPIHQANFIKQRKRWIFGNIQTLFNYRMSPLQNFDKWLSGVSQLTAWTNFLGLPILVLTCCVIMLPWIDGTQWLQVVGLSYSAFWLFTISKLFQFGSVNGRRTSDAFRTFLIHFSSLDIGAFYWWPVVAGKKHPFERTDKTGTRAGYSFNLFYPILHFVIFVSALNYASAIVALSAFFFGSLHIVSSSLDYRCRSMGNLKVNYNLKMQS